MSTKKWDFFLTLSENGGRGSPRQKSGGKNTAQKVIFFKTKNVPYGLKCKINHIF